MAPKPRHLAERFWPKVDTSGDCWLWTAHVAGSGEYGAIAIRTGVHKRATHVAWFLAHGEWPQRGLLVCHHCDNPRCVRPAHLFLGTPKDNSVDAKEKGRLCSGRRSWLSDPALRVARGVVRPGEKQWSARLTKQDVRELRAGVAAGTCRQSEYARRFGVDPTTIRDVIQRKTWAHV